jgi:hypothetical protein
MIREYLISRTNPTEDGIFSQKKPPEGGRLSERAILRGRAAGYLFSAA